MSDELGASDQERTGGESETRTHEISQPKSVLGGLLLLLVAGVAVLPRPEYRLELAANDIYASSRRTGTRGSVSGCHRVGAERAGRNGV